MYSFFFQRIDNQSENGEGIKEKEVKNNRCYSELDFKNRLSENEKDEELSLTCKNGDFQFWLMIFVVCVTMKGEERIEIF